MTVPEKFSSPLSLASLAATFLALLFVGSACGANNSATAADSGFDGGSVPEGQGDAGTFMKTIGSGGVLRSYLLHVPANVPSVNASAVFGFYGAGDNSSNFATVSGLLSLSDQEGFILLIPEAQAETWIGNGTFPEVQTDVNFVLQLVASIENQYSIDEKRLFACGFSRGAIFAGLIATGSGQTPALFDGYHFQNPFVAFGLSASEDGWAGQLDFNQSSPKRPLWLIHGTDDQEISFADGQAFDTELKNAGWTVTFTPVPGAPHDWLWRTSYGHPIEELWNFFVTNSVP